VKRFSSVVNPIVATTVTDDLLHCCW